VLGSLQNIESAEAAGDSYPALPSLAANGIGTVAAALFGSCFPTTIYIGHPGWKGLGARSGYSILNGVFFTVVALLGLTHLISALVPIEAGMAIVLWIGIVITAQAFQATPRAHAPAVAVGLFPAIAGWGVLVLGQTLGAAGMATGDAGLAAKVLADTSSFARAGLHLEGLVALSQGFILTCMVWAATSTCLLERKYSAAAGWAMAGAAASFFASCMLASSLLPGRRTTSALHRRSLEHWLCALRSVFPADEALAAPLARRNNEARGAQAREGKSQIGDTPSASRPSASRWRLASAPESETAARH